MNESRPDVAQLRKRDPAAWTTLLSKALETDELKVTSVDVNALGPCPGGRCRHHTFRYVLTLADQSDPVTLIGKRTNRVEASFYGNVARWLPQLAPRCLLATHKGERGWLLLDDVPDHFPPHKWTSDDVEEVVNGLVDLHATFWNQETELQVQGMPSFIGRNEFPRRELRAASEACFGDGPASVLSLHAIHNAGRLAPVLWRAANGLTIMRELGGWPGILGESHLAAAADLLDDPVPMLAPLRYLPATLIHGDPYSYHWRLTLFDELRLFDWQNAAVGPGIYDLVLFQEHLDLLYDQGTREMRLRREQLSTEETITDSYLLSMSARLGQQFSARVARQAIPAARCLFVLTNWFARFDSWFSNLPGKYTWQRVNRMSDEQLYGTVYEPLISLRPYLAGVFARFLHAFRTL